MDCGSGFRELERKLYINFRIEWPLRVTHIFIEVVGFCSSCFHYLFLLLDQVPASYIAFTAFDQKSCLLIKFCSKSFPLSNVGLEILVKFCIGFIIVFNGGINFHLNGMDSFSCFETELLKGFM